MRKPKIIHKVKPLKERIVHKKDRIVCSKKEVNNED